MTGLFLAIALAAPAGDAASVLKSLETAGRGLRTMRAEFVETKVLVLLDEKTESRGEVLLQVPGRLRWNYLAPQPSVTVVKDGRFARYFPKSKQVFRGPARGEADLLVGFGPGAAGLGQKYEVTLVGEETGGRPNGFGEAYFFRLPKSQLGVSVSSARFVRASGDTTDHRGVVPDIAAGPSELAASALSIQARNCSKL